MAAWRAVGWWPGQQRQQQLVQCGGWWSGRRLRHVTGRRWPGHRLVAQLNIVLRGRRRFQGRLASEAAGGPQTEQHLKDALRRRAVRGGRAWWAARPAARVCSARLPARKWRRGWLAGTHRREAGAAATHRHFSPTYCISPAAVHVLSAPGHPGRALHRRPRHCG